MSAERKKQNLHYPAKWRTVKTGTTHRPHAGKRQRYDFSPVSVRFSCAGYAKSPPVRPVHMGTGGTVFVKGARYRAGKSIEDPATGRVLRFTTAFPQAFLSCFSSFFRSRIRFGDMADMFVQKGIDPIATFCRHILEMQQNTTVFHPASCPVNGNDTDKQQPVHMHIRPKHGNCFRSGRFPAKVLPFRNNGLSRPAFPFSVPVPRFS